MCRFQIFDKNNQNMRHEALGKFLKQDETTINIDKEKI